MPASQCSAWTKCRSPSHQPRPAAKLRESNRPRPLRDPRDPGPRRTQTWRSAPKVPRARSCTSQSGSRQFMLLDFGGQADVKAGTTRRVVTRPQATAMRFDDGAADPKSHAGAMKFAGKKGIKDLVRLHRGQSHARVADRHHK